MEELISSIKIVKMYCWEPAFIEKIIDFRRSEIAKIRVRNVYGKDDLKDFTYKIEISNLSWSLINLFLIISFQTLQEVLRILYDRKFFEIINKDILCTE